MLLVLYRGLAAMLFLSVVAIGPVRAQIDVRILTDVSAPAQALDEMQLRAKGIEHLSALIPRGSRAGVWYFSRHVEEMVPYGRVDAMWQQLAAIHGRNMGVGGDLARLDNALQAALWDIEQASHTAPPQVIVFSNGVLRAPPGEAETARNRLLNELGPKLTARQVRIHVLATAAEGQRDTDFELMRQLTQLSGGLFVQVKDAAHLRQALSDMLDFARQSVRAPIDEAGRFRIAPGASSVTVMWSKEATLGDAAPVMRTPSGRQIDRLTYLESGRWVMGALAEVVTIQSPEPGWWQLQNVPLAQVLVIGELSMQIDGLRSPLVPGQENKAQLTLFHDGARLEHAGFLEQLHLRAWLKTPRDRDLMPVDRISGGFEILLVNLLDGPHVLEVELITPTFTRTISHPFVVRNPLQIELNQKPAQAADAWLSFSHAEVDFSTVRAAAKVRRPPQPGKLIPATKLPGGLYHVPLGALDGIVEVNFTISGNYLNSKGFFLKTKPVTVSLPMVGETQILRFDVDGRALRETRPVRDNGALSLADGASESAAEEPGADAPPAPVSTAAATETGSEVGGVAAADYALVPGWLTAVLGVLALLSGLGVWLWLRPGRLALATESP